MSKARKIIFILATGGLLALTMMILTVQPAHAAGPWYVAPGGDDDNDCIGPGTSCATINGALSKPGFVISDTVLVASGTYTGTGDEVVLLGISATLSGGWDAGFSTQSGTSTTDGEGTRRGVTVNLGVTATLERFTVQNGSRYQHGLEGSGGGIINEGSLTLNNCVVTSNRSSYTGGGISNFGTLTLNGSTVSENTGGVGGGGIISEGSLTLNNSAVSGNTSRVSGGGIKNSHGTLDLSNSTISGNTAYNIGGGVYVLVGTVTLNNTTVSDNTADYGGGISKHQGTVTLSNSIVAGNIAFQVGPDCGGTVGSLGHNLLGDTAGCTFTPTTGDLVGMDPRLFPLVGKPGYHPLPPRSPAIDAGNPAGCTDHLGSPLTEDQRGTPRPLDGDGDGSVICDMGAYEVDPAHPISQTFLPLVTHNYCTDFFDDFGDSSSGWEVADDAFLRSQYLNGEYRILTRISGYLYYFRAPTCDRQNYYVEVAARWVDTPGSSYGLIFGITGDFSQLYVFDVNTDFKQFRLFRSDAYGLTVLEGPTFSPAIKGSTAINLLKVTRNGSQITLDVNGTVLGTWSDGTIGGLTGAGLMTSPYNSNPVSDARFDNFSVTSIPSGGASSQRPNWVKAEESELSAPNAQHVPASGLDR